MRDNITWVWNEYADLLKRMIHWTIISMALRTFAEKISYTRFFHDNLTMCDLVHYTTIVLNGYCFIPKTKLMAWMQESTDKKYYDISLNNVGPSILA